MTTCPRCGSTTYEIESNSPSFDIARFDCGYGVALKSDAIGGGIVECSPCRSWMLRERLPRIARRFWPSGETWATAGVRLTLGCLTLAIEPLSPEALQSWVHLAGRIMIIMAAWGLISHAEKQFTTHVREAIKRTWQWGRA